VPKASEVASELRKLADSLEREPETEIEPFLIRTYSTSRSKQSFLNLARLLPRPFSKVYERDNLLILRGEDFTTPVSFRAQIDRDIVCRIVKPAQEAVYECEPLLSEAEEAQIGGAA